MSVDYGLPAAGPRAAPQKLGGIAQSRRPRSTIGGRTAPHPLAARFQEVQCKSNSVAAARQPFRSTPGRFPVPDRRLEAQLDYGSRSKQHGAGSQPYRNIAGSRRHQTGFPETPATAHESHDRFSSSRCDFSEPARTPPGLSRSSSRPVPSGGVRRTVCCGSWRRIQPASLPTRPWGRPPAHRPGSPGRESRRGD